MKVELFQDDDAGCPYENMEQASELLCFEPMHRDGWGKQFPVDEDRPLRALHRWLLLFGGYAVAIPFTFQDYGSGGCRASLVGLDSDRAAGFLVVSQETVAREWEDHPEHGTDVERAEKCARAEFATWAAWLEGDVAGFVVDRGGPDEDSCWGFYGPDAEKYAGEEARAAAESAAFDRAKREATLRRFLLDPDIDPSSIRWPSWHIDRMLEAGQEVGATFRYYGGGTEKLRERTGEKVRVLRRLRPTEADYEVGPMYRVRFDEDGLTTAVFESELTYTHAAEREAVAA
ncbi:MAG TPA: hypothetical protein VL264_05860 [Gaiella sp.]|nr:hypothetical protein [Gaiella sp.]